MPNCGSKSSAKLCLHLDCEDCEKLRQKIPMPQSINLSIGKDEQEINTRIEVREVVRLSAAEFKIWFDGFGKAITNGLPNHAQWSYLISVIQELKAEDK